MGLVPMGLVPMGARMVGRVVAALGKIQNAVAPGTLEAILQAGLMAIKAAQLYGVDVSADEAELYHDAIQVLDNTLDDELRQLTKDQQYSAVPTLLVLTREEQIMGGKGADNVVSDLAKALTFKLTAQADVSENGSYLGPYSYHTVLEVTGTLKMDQALSILDDADAEGVYKTGHNPFEPKYGEKLQSWQTRAYSTTFDFCKPEIPVVITKWGAGQELFYNQYGHAVEAWTDPKANAISQQAITQFAFPGAAKTGFPVELAKGAATSVYTTSATGTTQPLGTKYDVQVLIQLEHVPGG